MHDFPAHASVSGCAVLNEKRVRYAIQVRALFILLEGCFSFLEKTYTFKSTKIALYSKKEIESLILWAKEAA
jgi:hypothetical protein